MDGLMLGSEDFCRKQKKLEMEKQQLGGGGKYPAYDVCGCSDDTIGIMGTLTGSVVL